MQVHSFLGKGRGNLARACAQLLGAVLGLEGVRRFRSVTFMNPFHHVSHVAAADCILLMSISDSDDSLLQIFPPIIKYLFLEVSSDFCCVALS